MKKITYYGTLINFGVGNEKAFTSVMFYYMGGFDMSWISIKDELPKDGDNVLGLCESGVIECNVTDGELTCVGFLSHGCGCCSSEDVYTHWMNKPEPPKN